MFEFRIRLGMAICAFAWRIHGLGVKMFPEYEDEGIAHV